MRPGLSVCVLREAALTGNLKSPSLLLLKQKAGPEPSVGKSLELFPLRGLGGVWRKRVFGLK